MIIEIPGPPIAKKRARFFRCGDGIRSYDLQHSEMDIIRLYMLPHKNPQPNVAYAIDLEFHMPIPLSLSKPAKVRLLNAPHLVKPDVDNLAKMYLDCGNGIFWHDDKQIISLKILKKYSDDPKTIIRINE